MTSLCGFSALQSRLGFHYTEKNKKGKCRLIDRWFEMKRDGWRDWKRITKNVIMEVDLIRGNQENQAEKRTKACDRQVQIRWLT